MFWLPTRSMSRMCANKTHLILSSKNFVSGCHNFYIPLVQLCQKSTRHYFCLQLPTLFTTSTQLGHNAYSTMIVRCTFSSYMSHTPYLYSLQLLITVLSMPNMQQVEQACHDAIHLNLILRAEQTVTVYRSD